MRQREYCNNEQLSAETAQCLQQRQCLQATQKGPLHALLTANLHRRTHQYTDKSPPRSYYFSDTPIALHRLTFSKYITPTTALWYALVSPPSPTSHSSSLTPKLHLLPSHLRSRDPATSQPFLTPPGAPLHVPKSARACALICP
jgi:hypothetical protein